MFLDLIGDQLKAAGWDYLYEWTSNDPTEFITPNIFFGADEEYYFTTEN